jgi:hypothetical protein
MELIGGAATVTQLISNISDAIRVIRRRIDEFRNADTHVATLKDLLISTEDLIHAVEDDLEILRALEREAQKHRIQAHDGGHDAHARDLHDPLEPIRGHLESLKSLMAKFVDEGEINRWIWLSNATKCKILVQKLSVHRSGMADFYLILKA